MSDRNSSVVSGKDVGHVGELLQKKNWVDDG